MVRAELLDDNRVAGDNLRVGSSPSPAFNAEMAADEDVFNPALEVRGSDSPPYKLRTCR